MARPPDADRTTRHVLDELERLELLLQSGNEHPSIVTLIAGGRVRGSWWSHPKANLIYWVCQDLEADARVTAARLLGGKVTHVWHTRWPELCAVALARDAWQWDGLGSAERSLVAEVDADEVRTDRIDWRGGGKLGDVCRLLERRLLVKADEIHTDTGRHAKVLGSWQRFWRQHGKGRLPEVAVARSRLEALVGDAARLLPWCTARHG
jgi:hypothetical protein